MLGYIMLALGLLAGVASVATLIYKKCYKVRHACATLCGRCAKRAIKSGFL